MRARNYHALIDIEVWNRVGLPCQVVGPHHSHVTGCLCYSLQQLIFIHREHLQLHNSPVTATCKRTLRRVNHRTAQRHQFKTGRIPLGILC